MSSADVSHARLNDYGAARLSLASPHDIRSWSFGEVKKPDILDWRTEHPMKDSLFCERIFAPCSTGSACGKHRGVKHKGVICGRCGVEVAHTR